MHFIGRRRELVAVAMVYFVSAQVIAVAPSFAIMVVRRFIYGMGIGLVYIPQSYDSSLVLGCPVCREFLIVPC